MFYACRRICAFFKGCFRGVDAHYRYTNRLRPELSLNSFISRKHCYRYTNLWLMPFKCNLFLKINYTYSSTYVIELP